MLSKKNQCLDCIVKLRINSSKVVYGTFLATPCLISSGKHQSQSCARVRAMVLSSTVHKQLIAHKQTHTPHRQLDLEKTLNQACIEFGTSNDYFFSTIPHNIIKEFLLQSHNNEGETLARSRFQIVRKCSLTETVCCSQPEKVLVRDTSGFYRDKVRDKENTIY